MSWKCPKCNTVHPYSVRKCPCSDASSSRKKVPPPTRTGEEQKRETVELELANENHKTTASQKHTENFANPTKSKELRNDPNTLGQEGETSKQAHEHFDGVTKNDAEDVSLQKLEDYGEIGGVDLNYSKEETMGVSMQNTTSSPFERFVFTITRVLALCGAVVILAGIVFLAIALLSTWTKGTKVTYNEIAEELSSTDITGGSDEAPAPPTPSTQVEIPKNLRTFFSGDNTKVLQNQLRNLDQSQKRDFLNNLSAVYDEVQRKFKGDEKIHVQFVNQYANLKLVKLNQNEFEKYAALATKVGYVAGIFGLLLILSILSPVLVLLAIERNTRPDPAFSNRRNL